LKLDLFKDAVIRMILETDKARMKVAKHLMERTIHPPFIQRFERHLPSSLEPGHLLIEIYRCLRHIRSGDIDFDYEFSDKTNVIDMFDSVFCSDKTVANYTFFINVRNSFDEPITKFDMSIMFV
jgi:hypothetical protein